jgi:phosphomevalonate kinase
MAVDRRARATTEVPDPEGAPAPASPFLAAAQRVVSAELGADSPEALAICRVRVDSSALSDESGAKLGLGSSAAVTVAAIGAGLAAGTPRGAPLDRTLLHRLAHRAHGDAQATAGARGSGADIAACVHGGLLHLEAPERPGDPLRISPLALPSSLELVWVWTGQPADTPTLLAGVDTFAARDPTSHADLLERISRAAATFIRACREQRTGLAILALGAAGQAIDDLGRAAGVDLVTPAHRALARAAASARGIAKPTGAAGGDTALTAFPNPTAARWFRDHLTRLGMKPLALQIDPEGARIEPAAPS